MRVLVERGKVDKATLAGLNRFMSIGSCGGVRIYSELNRLFHGDIDIFATIGTGKAAINNAYNRQLFEIIARSPDTIDWEEVTRQSAFIFNRERDADYLQPGSLPAILHKMTVARQAKQDGNS